MIRMSRLSARFFFYDFAEQARRSRQFLSCSGYRSESNIVRRRPPLLRVLKRLTTAKAYDVWKNKRAVFIDVLPHAPRPEGLPANAFWREPEIKDIPGSIWLPDRIWRHRRCPIALFSTRLSRGNRRKQKSFISFLLPERLLMSWNAAKRALTLGYHDVSWYPEGSDGWAAAAYPLEIQTPKPHTEIFIALPN